MALARHEIGICGEKTKGRICKGKVVEHRVSLGTAENPEIGPGQWAGHKCEKCKKVNGKLKIDFEYEKLLEEIVKIIKKNPRIKKMAQKK